MGAEWVEGKRWEGGRVRKGKRGEVFVIERMVADRRFSIPLHGVRERDTLGELRLFERDPVGYFEAYKAKRLDRLHGHARLLLTVDLVDAFAPKGKDELGGEEKSRAHARAVRGYLLAWSSELKGRDFKRLSVLDLDKALREWGNARHHRVVALKSLTAWMRESGLLKEGDDPARLLKVPPVRAEKLKRRKAPAMEAVEKIYRELSPPEWTGSGPKANPKVTQAVRDVVVLQAKFGMHTTEVQRIARGQCELRRVDDQGEIAGVVRFVHKSGRVHTLSLDAQAMGAAERLTDRGEGPSQTYILRSLKKAAKRAGVSVVLLGQLRHGVVTWAQERVRWVRPGGGKGATLDEISAVTGHSAATARKFYSDVQVPPMLDLGIRLLHPADPPLQEVPRPATAETRAG